MEPRLSLSTEHGGYYADPFVAEPLPETIVCPQVVFAGESQRPTMREIDCARRLQENLRCRLTCTAVDHIRERLKIPPPTKAERSYNEYAQEKARKAALKPVGVCKCGGQGLGLLQRARRKPAVKSVICAECHDILHHKWLPEAKGITEKSRRAQMRKLARAIKARTGHAPSVEYAKGLGG